MSKEETKADGRENINRVVVEIIEAKIETKAEYWVKVTMSSTSIPDKDNTWQTKPTKKTADPVWKEVHKFEAWAPGVVPVGKVIFELWAKSGGMFSHTDEIANAMIPLSDVLHKAKNGFLEQRLALRDPSGGAAGELHVKLAYTAYAVWRKAEDEKAEKEKAAVAQRVKDQEAAKKAAETVAKKKEEEKAREEAQEAEVVAGIAKKWKTYATGGKLTTPAGDVWEYRGDGALRLAGTPYVWYLHATKTGVRLHTPAVNVVGECSVSRADQFSWFVRYHNKHTGKEAVEMLSTYDWTEKKANISSKAIEELPPYWTLNVTASNAASAANKANPRKWIYNVPGTEMHTENNDEVFKAEGSVPHIVFLFAAMFRRHLPHAQKWLHEQHQKYLIDSLGPAKAQMFVEPTAIAGAKSLTLTIKDEGDFEVKQFASASHTADSTPTVQKVKGPTTVSLKPDRGVLEVVGVGSLLVCDATTAYVLADKALLYDPLAPHAHEKRP